MSRLLARLVRGQAGYRTRRQIGPERPLTPPPQVPYSAQAGLQRARAEGHGHAFGAFNSNQGRAGVSERQAFGERDRVTGCRDARAPYGVTPLPP